MYREYKKSIESDKKRFQIENGHRFMRSRNYKFIFSLTLTKKETAELVLDQIYRK